MVKKYKIGFAGTSAFACPFFEELQQKFDVRLLMTKQVDVKAKSYSFAKFLLNRDLSHPIIYSGEKLGLNQLEDAWAEVQKIGGNRIPCVYPAKMREVDEGTFDELDAMIVIAYGHKIPKRMLEKCVWINLHGSVLPKFRGAAPINYAIMSGEEASGLSATIMVEEIDAGPVIDTIEVPILPEDDSAVLAMRMQEIGKEWFAETVFKYLEGGIKAVPQDDSIATFAPSITAEHKKIDWTKSAREIHNKIRGLAPNMCCSVEIAGIRLKLLASEILPDGWTALEILQIGQFINPNKIRQLIIRCGTGFLRLTSVIPESSREMSDESFVRGYSKLLSNISAT